MLQALKKAEKRTRKGSYADLIDTHFDPKVSWLLLHYYY